MTKREYIESIGYTSIINYKCELVCFKYYCKEKYKRTFEQRITLSSPNKYDVFCFSISTQEEIDALQIAFNNVKRDYEEMQKYED